MTEVKWMIEDGIFHADTAKLADEVVKQGMDCQLIDYKYELIHGIGSTPKKFNKNDCIICLGSFQEIDNWAKYSSQWIIWCNLNNFKCSSYFPYYGKFLLNKKYVMMPLKELIRQKHDIYLYLNETIHPSRINDMKIFIRPDSGRKSFAGQLFKYDELDNHFIFDFVYDKNLMVIASSPIENIEKEWRFFVVNGTVVTGSQYHNNNEIEILSEYEAGALNYAQNVVLNGKYYPDPAFVIDIAKTSNNNYSVVEINSFSCSDPYICDFEKYVKEISKLAIKEFEDLMVV